LALSVEAGGTSLTADGLSSTTLTLYPTRGGLPAPDGTELSVDCTLGSLEIEPVSDGAATAIFRAGTWPGTSTLTSDEWALSGDLELELLPGDPVSAQLHLHGSLSEGTASMSWHASVASVGGVDMLWWTDHDTGYYVGGHGESTGLDFESGSLQSKIPIFSERTASLQWTEVESSLEQSSSEVRRTAARSGDFGWRIEGLGTQGQRLYHRLDATPDVNFKSLLAEVSFSVWIRAKGDPGLQIEIPLSATAAGEAARSDRYNKIVLHHLDEEPPREELAYYIPMELEQGAWTQVSLDLSALAPEAFPDLGLDQHAEFVEVSLIGGGGRQMSYDIDDFSWPQAVHGEELRELQRAHLAAMEFDTRHLVGFEISGYGMDHMNAYGSEVPLIDYTQAGGWGLQEAVEHVHDAGGIVSYNHMFSTSGALFEREDLLERIDARSAELVRTQVYGCDLLEVGYRQRGGAVEHFLRVWDKLSEGGVWITGIGVSDQHARVYMETTKNNFVTWISSSSTDEDDLIWNLKRGAAWFGDPTLFPDADVSLSFVSTTAQATAGQVVVEADPEQELELAISWLGAGWTVFLVDATGVLESWVTESDGAFAQAATIDAGEGTAVRVEVYDAEDSAALFSNPIYFLAPGDEHADAVPVERIPAP